MLFVSLLATGWTLPALTIGAGHRTVAPRACAPFRSDDKFDYFRKVKELTVTVDKPIGAVLTEVADGGVKVGEVREGGSAAATGLIKVGDRFITVSGTDVSMADLDSVRCLLDAAFNA